MEACMRELDSLTLLLSSGMQTTLFQAQKGKVFGHTPEHRILTKS